MNQPINAPTVQIYEPYSTTLRADPRNELAGATVLAITKSWPGGIYTTANIMIRRNVDDTLPWRGSDRVVIRNGHTVIFEGAIAGIGRRVGQGADQAVILECVGYWGWLLGRTTWDKRWADNRISDAVWRVDTTAAAAELATDDRLARIRVTPKAEAWTTEQYSIAYTMPTGETIKRVVLDRELQEGTQQWKIGLYDPVGAAFEWQQTTSGTGSQDDTLGTPRQKMEFRFESNTSPQTPTADGTYFGEISNVVVYSETGNIDLTEITKDIRTQVSNLNSDEGNIDSNTFTLEPFFTNGSEKMTDILIRATSFGDASFNQWAAYIRESDIAATPDGKPVLFLKQYPALTDYDYAIRIDEARLAAPFELVKDIAGIANWIAVRYRDQEDNRDIIITPDDDSSLTDSDSVTKWGELHLVTNIGVATQAMALNIGQRILAQRKDPRFVVSGPIVVNEKIRNKAGNVTPACEVMPGKRIKIENFLDDEADVSGAGLTFYVSMAVYDDTFQQVQISTGTPDALGVILAQRDLRGL